MILKFLKCILFMISIHLITNCNQIDTIQYSPNLTPSDFLSGQHFWQIPLGENGFVLSQPSSSFFVFLLSFFYIYVGYQFIRDLRAQKSRLWWAIGFFLTGIAAILAGISYQAFGYELKCSGREYCRWTTWWEINYEILQNAGMNGFLVAAAYTNAKGLFRKILIGYSLLNTIVYSCLVIYGAIIPIQFFISFEFLELSCLPAVVFFLASSAYGYFTKKDNMNLNLLITWLLLILVMIAYVVSLEMDLTSLLWNKGIWFTENDVLHVGLIFWVWFICKKLPDKIQDLN
ncbi:DUF6962 family protein [Leptospira sp. GIMC2001]|uniref:DUF6962 family protein n=1 Tax=Leptospira sp. GIMC2001 TaxID=1513297 RepID=UPI00234B9A66|nr:hypothetical protein [Leptospira sp. GIMC2001]WCL50127.1 hypothetical protein O4O04_04735 [Leptospira sp. GIMC2001]